MSCPPDSYGREEEHSQLHPTCHISFIAGTIPETLRIGLTFPREEGEQASAFCHCPTIALFIWTMTDWREHCPLCMQSFHMFWMSSFSGLWIAWRTSMGNRHFHFLLVTLHMKRATMWGRDLLLPFFMHSGWSYMQSHQSCLQDCHLPGFYLLSLTPSSSF